MPDEVTDTAKPIDAGTLSEQDEHTLNYWLADPPVTVPPTGHWWVELRKIIRRKLSAVTRERDEARLEATSAKGRAADWEKDSYVKEKIANGAIVERDKLRSRLAALEAAVAKVVGEMGEGHGKPQHRAIDLLSKKLVTELQELVKK